MVIGKSLRPRAQNQWLRPSVRALVLGATLVSACGNTASDAATLRVPTLEYPHIAGAIDAAASGDTIVVEPGTYTGANNRNLGFESKELVVRSEAGPELTILDVQGSAANPGRGFLIDGGQTEATVVDGFTIINGWMSTEESLVGSAKVDDLHDLSAGGLKVNSLSSPIVRNMIIRQCHSEYTGGGISVEVLSSPTIQDCLIVDCSAGIQGGGVSIETGSTPIVERCVITGNRAPDAGGIACHSEASGAERFILRSCTIAGNRATRGGGAMFMAFSETTVEQTIIYGNCSDGSDGILVEPLATADFACSLVDTSNTVIDPRASVSYDENSILDQAPQFCEPEDCQNAPNDLGDYGLKDVSPCVATNSPCGRRIGAYGLGICALPPATVRGSWGSIKARFQADPSRRE